MPSNSDLPNPAALRFVEESRGNPLGAYPELVLQARPYNEWLTAECLEPVLRRWTDFGARQISSVPHDFEWGCGRARDAFAEILPAAALIGDPALLATLAVTANLERTLAIVGESVLRPPDAQGDLHVFALSRAWCGLIEYDEHSPYFPAAIKPPRHAARLHPARRDLHHLLNALWCTAGDVDRACDTAVAILRNTLANDGVVRPGDLHHLHPHSRSRRR